jgi:hypothetical protein
VECSHTEGGALLEDFARRLRAGEADDEVERWQRRRFVGQCGGEMDRAVGGKRGDAALAARAVDHAKVELLAHAAPQHLAQMAGTRIGRRDRAVEFLRGEEDEIHGRKAER